VGCMYRLTFPSGKAYIGITKEAARERFSEHAYDAKRGLKKAISRAFRKYGSEAVKLETLVIASDWAYLCDLERKAIAAFGTKWPGGYNMTDGGEGSCGYKHSEETRAHLCAVHSRTPRHTTPHSEDAKAKMSAAHRRMQSEETRRRISQAQIGVSRGVGRKLSDEHRAAIAAGNSGKKRTEEQRARISAAAAERERVKREQRSQQWT
jgi:group I intron endonuclease